MTAKFQLVIDCADPEPLARFWVAVLGYEFEPPPDGYDNWDDYWRAVGVSEDELGVGLDCIVDPAGRGPRIWFQVVPEKKTLKNRLHLDITVSGGRANPIETRRRLVGAATGGARRHVGQGPLRGRPGPLRDRHAGSRGQRVRHQLTIAGQAQPSYGSMRYPPIWRAFGVLRTGPSLRIPEHYGRPLTALQVVMPPAGSLWAGSCAGSDAHWWSRVGCVRLSRPRPLLRTPGRETACAWPWTARKRRRPTGIPSSGFRVWPGPFRESHTARFGFGLRWPWSSSCDRVGTARRV